MAVREGMIAVTYCTDGFCLELVLWNLGRGCYRELSLRARQISGA